MATKVKQLAVTERIVDTKRHTVGYVINGVAVSRAEAVTLANRNWLKGVKVKKAGIQTYLMTDGTNKLYSLPTRVGF